MFCVSGYTDYTQWVILEQGNWGLPPEQVGMIWISQWWYNNGENFEVSALIYCDECNAFATDTGYARGLPLNRIFNLPLLKYLN